MPDPRFKFSYFQPVQIIGKDGIVLPVGRALLRGDEDN